MATCIAGSSNCELEPKICSIIMFTTCIHNIVKIETCRSFFLGAQLEMDGELSAYLRLYIIQALVYLVINGCYINGALAGRFAR